jgi:hypothetical protein
VTSAKLTIPQIRHCLLALAGEEETAGRPENAELLRYLAEQTHRRPAVRRAPASGNPRHPPLEAVTEYIEANPDASYMTIATEFNTNIGGISEVLNPREAAE